MHVIKKYISNFLQKLISVSKTELRSISADLRLPFGADVIKDDLIKNTSNVMINKQVETTTKMLTLIEK